MEHPSRGLSGACSAISAFEPGQRLPMWSRRRSQQCLDRYPPVGELKRRSAKRAELYALHQR